MVETTIKMTQDADHTATAGDLHGDPNRHNTMDAEKGSSHRASEHDREEQKDEKSPGVQRIEAISSMFTLRHRWVLFGTIFLLAYCYGLDGTVRYTLQIYALASFGNSANISTVTIVRSIVGAAAQPVYAKISDYFGRMSILFVCIFFVVIGTILQAASKNLATFSGGAVIYQFGYTGLMLLVEVIIADTSSLRSRLFFSYIPAAPFLVNAWVTGNVANASLKTVGWEWGIGMWAIIFPVVAVPLFLTFWSAKRRAQKAGLLSGIPTLNLASPALWYDFCVKTDIVGLALLAAWLCLVLIPFSLAGGMGNLWKTAHVITPLVVGVVVTLPAFIVWEFKFASHPFLPKRLFKDRQIVFGFLIALWLNMSWYLQGDYLYYTLIVAFDKSIEVANRVTMIYSFTSVVIGFSLGLVVRHVRRLKMFIVAGGAMILLAYGLLVRYRGGNSTSDFAGLVAAETILGIAGGLLPYPTQALVQSAVKHERTAIVTAVFFTFYSIGSALGNTIAAGIWMNTMPRHLMDNFAALVPGNASTLATYAFADPFTFVAEYPVGTPERLAIDRSYHEVQRLLCITGLCLAVVMFFLTFGLRDVTLTDEQSFEHAEEEWAEGQKGQAAGSEAGERKRRFFGLL